jgi:hypothetical protein
MTPCGPVGNINVSEENTAPIIGKLADLLFRTEVWDSESVYTIRGGLKGLWLYKENELRD